MPPGVSVINHVLGDLSNVSRRSLPLLMSLRRRKRLVMSNHTHTWWHYITTLREVMKKKKKFKQVSRSL